MKKGVIFYTNNVLDERIRDAVLKKLKVLTRNMEVVSVSHKPIDFGKNIVMDLPSESESIFKQISKGLENISADIIYLVEHDVLYNESHFIKIPDNPRHFLYNQNVWQVDSQTGQAIFRHSKRTSQLIVYKENLIHYFDLLFEQIRKRKYYQMWGVAPMTHTIDGIPFRGLRGFISEYPNIDIRHNDNLSHYVYTKKDIIADGVPYWGKTLGRFNEWLDQL